MLNMWCTWQVSCTFVAPSAFQLLYGTGSLVFVYAKIAVYSKCHGYLPWTLASLAVCLMPGASLVTLLFALQF